MSSYTNLPQVSAQLKRDLTTNEVAMYEMIADVVEKYINRHIGGSYGEVSATTRYYDGGTQYLDIDPVHTVTDVAMVDEDGVSDYDYDVNDDYELTPYNDTVKNTLQARNGKFPRGHKNIAVTGKFTLDDTVPDDIAYLATYLIAKFYNRLSVGDVKKESIEGYSREFSDLTVNDETVKTILDNYTDDRVFI